MNKTKRRTQVWCRGWHLVAFGAVILALGCTEPLNSDQLTLRMLTSDVANLSSDKFEGRGTGTTGERLAAEYVSRRMGNVGLTPAGDSLWYQDFTFRPQPSIRKHGGSDSSRLAMSTVQPITGRNVLGAIDKGHERWVVIGAHYDHLGRGDANSLSPGDTSIHHGADDNASGVAALLELALRFYDSPIEENILFAAFSGEEKGLAGSKHFVQEPTIPLEAVSYMINLDMVGRMNSERSLAVYGFGTAPEWADAVATANTDSLNLLFHESGIGPSDHTTFYLEDIPVLHLFTGQHDDYHKPSDTNEKLNYEGILSVVNFAERVVRELTGEAPLTFTKTQDQQQSERPKFKVTLGVVPDYMFEGTGVRLDGASEGRPGHTAGLIKGDVIIRIGDIEITDIYAYMNSLNSFEPGTEAEIVVLRNGKEKKLVVKWD